MQNRSITPRQQLLSVFESRNPSPIPFVADLSYIFDVFVRQGKVVTGDDPDEDMIRFCVEHHTIPYYLYGRPFGFRHDGVTIRTETQGLREITEYIVDGHRLTDIREYNEVSFSWAPTQYAVASRQDLEILLELVRRTVCVERQDVWNRLNQKVGDLGLPICSTPRSPLPALLVDWAGVENTIFLLADEPQLVQQVLDAFDAMNDAAFDILTYGPAKLIHFTDNLNGQTVASLWDQYLADYYQKRVKQIHAAGKFCASHLDGTLAGMIGRLAKSGIDAIESITPAPVGDLTLEQVERDMADFDTILWGGIPGAMFAQPFTWEQVRQQVDTLRDLHRRGRRVIAASADQVPPDGQMEIVRQIGEYLDA